MPRKHASYIDNPQWSICPKKAESREETIVLTYREHFGHSIPDDRQYWTMCGAYFDKNNLPAQGELFQVKNAGLITEEQFVGVDDQPEIIAKNKFFYPDINWVCDDLLYAMREAKIGGKFTPAIINYDGVMMKKYGVDYFVKLLLFLDDNWHEDLLLIGNFVIKSPYPFAPVHTGQDIMDAIKTSYIKPVHWTPLPQYYQYNGTGRRSRTVMATFIWLKSKHSSLVFV